MSDVNAPKAPLGMLQRFKFLDHKQSQCKKARPDRLISKKFREKQLLYLRFSDVVSESADL